MDIVTTSSDESDDDARETLAQKEREAEEAAEAARERELEAESILLDKQIEDEIRGLLPYPTLRDPASDCGTVQK